jgi:hypothetical protein
MSVLLKALVIGVIAEVTCFSACVFVGNWMPQTWGDRIFNLLQARGAQIIDSLPSVGFEGQAGKFLMIPVIQSFIYALIALAALNLLVARRQQTR